MPDQNREGTRLSTAVCPNGNKSAPLASILYHGPRIGEEAPGHIGEFPHSKSADGLHVIGNYLMLICRRASAVQTFPHRLGQAQGVVGFLEEAGAALADKFRVEVVHVVAAGENDFEIGRASCRERV